MINNNYEVCKIAVFSCENIVLSLTVFINVKMLECISSQFSEGIFNPAFT